MKEKSLGTAGNSLAGILGGGGGSLAVQALAGGAAPGVLGDVARGVWAGRSSWSLWHSQEKAVAE